MNFSPLLLESLVQRQHLCFQVSQVAHFENNHQLTLLLTSPERHTYCHVNISQKLAGNIGGTADVQWSLSFFRKLYSKSSQTQNILVTWQKWKLPIATQRSVYLIACPLQPNVSCNSPMKLIWERHQ